MRDIRSEICQGFVLPSKGRSLPVIVTGIALYGLGILQGQPDGLHRRNGAVGRQEYATRLSQSKFGSSEGAP